MVSGSANIYLFCALVRTLRTLASLLFLLCRSFVCMVVLTQIFSFFPVFIRFVLNLLWVLVKTMGFLCAVSACHGCLVLGRQPMAMMRRRPDVSATT